MVWSIYSQVELARHRFLVLTFKWLESFYSRSELLRERVDDYRRRAGPKHSDLPTLLRERQAGMEVSHKGTKGKRFFILYYNKQGMCFKDASYSIAVERTLCQYPNLRVASKKASSSLDKEASLPTLYKERRD